MYCSSAVHNRSRFLEYLNIYKNQNFSGQLNIASDTRCWRIYLGAGELFWCEDGGDWKVRCLRLLDRHCDRASELKCFEYSDLARWVESKKLSAMQAGAIISDCCREVIFDILQQERSHELSLVADEYEVSIHPLLASISLTRSEENAQKDWQEWQQDGLEEVSLNAIPYWLPATGSWRLQEEMYCLLKPSINRQNTLREIAGNLNWELHYCAKYFRDCAIAGVMAWQMPTIDPQRIACSIAPAKLAPKQSNEDAGGYERENEPLLSLDAPSSSKRKAFPLFSWLSSNCKRFLNSDVSNTAVNSMTKPKSSSTLWFKASKSRWKAVAAASALAILAPLGLTQSERLQTLLPQSRYHLGKHKRLQSLPIRGAATVPSAIPNSSKNSKNKE